MKFTPENITELKENEIFVFGSNTQGRHSLGAALIAKQKFGAIYGQSWGLQGQSYAIITKDLTKPHHEQLKSISLEFIHDQIIRFYNFAAQNKHLTFYVVKLGCSLAGWSIPEIAEQFRNHKYIPPNIIFPKEFIEIIWKEKMIKIWTKPMIEPTNEDNF